MAKTCILRRNQIPLEAYDIHENEIANVIVHRQNIVMDSALSCLRFVNMDNSVP